MLPDEEQGASTRPFWSGTITFGLVSIPVELYPANRSNGVALRMLGPNNKPLARRYYSAKSGRDLNDDDIVRGYEIKKGKFVEITDEELERLAPESSRDINLRLFVDEKSIPRLYFERGYFLAPGGSVRAYKLLAETMERTARAGIATFVMRGKEYLVAIIADNGILRAETMRFADEIRTPQDVGLPKREKPSPAAVHRFERFISQHSRTSLPLSELKDKEAQDVLKLVKRKQSRKSNVIQLPGTRREAASLPDLVTVLRKALAKGGKPSVKVRAKRSR
jgi:DNA end-binding protein Ku